MTDKNKTKKLDVRVGNEGPTDDIIVRGARMHNLKNITVRFPRNKFIVVTGVSGSGKSSLTMNTLFAEGQRRYAESLSSYARQFMSRMGKPDVDSIDGLCPAIAIEQKVISGSSRSTVGTMTEIQDYLKLLFARIGKIISPVSGREVKKDDVSIITEELSKLSEGSRFLVLVSFQCHSGRTYREEMEMLVQNGFSRIFILSEKKPQQQGETYAIEDILAMPETEFSELTNNDKKNLLYILIDRLTVHHSDEEWTSRLANSLETAFYEGEGKVDIVCMEKKGDAWAFKKRSYSDRLEMDGMRFLPLEPNLFSFNNPLGACPACEGFGKIIGLDEDLIIPNRAISVFDGAIAPWKGEVMGWWRDQFIHGAGLDGFPVHHPVGQLSEQEYALLWNGKPGAYQGIHDFFNDIQRHQYKIQNRVMLSRYRGKTQCPECHGYRLRKEALYVHVGDKHIGALQRMTIADLRQWFSAIPLSAFEKKVSLRIRSEITSRLDTLLEVGLGYLTLDRQASSLSGGESQRIQLTRSLGSNLTNSLYILDEPSIGLHPRDTHKLIGVLKKLRDLGNTVIVVEHDETMMRACDHILDMGPLAAHLGGELIAEGTLDQLKKNDKSLTGRYLSGRMSIERPEKHRISTKFLMLKGASMHNLKHIDVSFPLGTLCVVTGVSGSGKTTLVKRILYPAMQKALGLVPSEKPGAFVSLGGNIEAISAVELVDQNPIGKSSRSNPVTYIKAYDIIRNLFASLPLSKQRGYKSGYFSFNIDGGRCDACKGEGVRVVEMQFLADVHLTCEVCGGKRFKPEVLEVTYNGKNISDVLDMSVEEAIAFFAAVPQLQQSLKPLQDVGLGYIKLGQPSDTLSGGEAQRVKLAKFLALGSTHGHVLFLFDEPTTGLHFHDIGKLLSSFNALIDQGHSVIVIEHNTDVISRADWVIDLGPEAGDAGGELVYTGTPEKLKFCKASFTGKYL